VEGHALEIIFVVPAEIPPMVSFELDVGIVKNGQVCPVLAGTMGYVVGWMC